jgi:hypothetical protein
MLETIIVTVIVIVAGAYIARSLHRSMTGKSNGSCCGEHCTCKIKQEKSGYEQK